MENDIYCDILAKHINTQCRENAGLVKVIVGGI
jgi:hypothetical protein